MIRLVLAALLAFACTASPADVVIRNDPGGRLTDRLDQIARFRAAGTRVEIRGHCDSSCTLLLGLPLACVAPTARLGFHGPQSQRYGISLPPDDFTAWSDVMADHYPPGIAAMFMSRWRENTLGIVTITGTEAVRLGARPCGKGKQ